MANLEAFDFNTSKKLHGKGTDRHTDRHTDRQTDTRTSQLLDRIDPVGRLGEKLSFSFHPNNIFKPSHIFL